MSCFQWGGYLSRRTVAKVCENCCAGDNCHTIKKWRPHSRQVNWSLWGSFPCSDIKRQECFSRSQLSLAKTLVNLTKDVIPLRLFNPTDQPQTICHYTNATWCEPVEEVSKASQQEVQTKEAPAGRACRVTPSTASLLNHLVDFYQRTNDQHHAWMRVRKWKR